MSLKHLLSARRCSTCWGCSCELSKFCTLMEPTFQWSRRGIFLGVRSQSLPFYTWGSDSTERSRNSPEVTQLVQVVGTQAVSSFTHGTIEHPPSHNQPTIYLHSVWSAVLKFSPAFVWWKKCKIGIIALKWALFHMADLSHKVLVTGDLWPTCTDMSSWHTPATSRLC